MTRPSIFLVIGLLLTSCSNDKSCLATIKQAYFLKGCNGDKCGYAHTVMLSSYKEGCFNEYDFIDIVDKYLDTVRINLPVTSITFVKPFDFHPSYDSRDFEYLDNNSLVRISFSEQTWGKKVPEFSAITIWTKGQRKNLDYIEVSSRQQKMDFYHSKK